MDPLRRPWVLFRRVWDALDVDARVFALGYLVLLPFFLAPLVFTRYLPGLDLPFHLAIADLLSKGVGPDSPYAGYYEIKNLWAPYSLHYGALVALGKLVGGVAIAHNVVMCLYVAALPLSLGALLGTCGRSRIPALLAFPLAYNLCLHYGFISFCLSLPALLTLFAALCHHLKQQTFSWWSWSACAITGVILFLSHLQNLLFGLCGAAVIVLFSHAAWRRKLAALGTLAPTFASLLFWNWQSSFNNDPAAQKKTLAFAWQAVKTARLADLAARRDLAHDIEDRLRLIPLTTLKGFADLIDIEACKAVLYMLVAYVFMGFIGLILPRGEAPRSRYRIASWILAFGALTAYLALPHHLWAFELMTFFPRFTVLLLLLLIPLVPSGLRRLPWQGSLMAVAPAVVVGVLYGGILFDRYRDYRKEITDFVKVLSQTPRDGKLMGIIHERRSKVMRIESAMVALPAFYVATRPSPKTMVPVHYCGMRHMPCAVTKPMPWGGPWNSIPFSWDAADMLFDYYISQTPAPSPAVLGPLAPKVDVLARSGLWTVYRRRPRN